MLFIVNRTSNHIYDEEIMDLEDYNEYISKEKKPCEEAKLINCLIDSYGCGYDLEHQNRWCIELSTTGDIMNFIDKYGRIIIDKNDTYNIPVIEIYDDYKE